MTWSLHGTGVGDRVAIGRAWVLAAASLEVPRHGLEPGQVGPEQARFRQAIERVRGELMAVQDSLSEDSAPEVMAFLDLQSLVLSDPLLAEQTEARIAAEQTNAEWALVQQYELLAEEFDALEDPYLRERKADIQQVVERILKAMAGGPGLSSQLKELAQDSAQPWILVARDIAPADMLLIREHAFAGFATDSGSPTAHTAILARSLGLPAVVGLGHLHSLIEQGEELVLDARSGVVVGGLDPELRADYLQEEAEQKLRDERLWRLRGLVSATLDGQRVQLMANLDLPEDATAAAAAGCDGIGLLRSEFLFMNRSSAPSEETQFEAYRMVVQAMGGRPVTIRTLDSGADKAVTYLSGLNRTPPLNPALALRAIRLSLAEPELFLVQLRALLRASAYGPLQVMIPLISGPSELISARRMIQRAMGELKAKGVAYDPQLRVGAMIEVPSAAIAIDGLLAHMDFASIGTNDLIQYTLAIDRTDREVSHLYDPLHPAVIRLIRETIRACDRAGTPISLCGEMAGEPQFTRLLLGLGLRSFSMHAVEILRVKQEVLRSDIRLLERPVARLLRLPDSRRVRAGLESLGS
ncbi:MAG: phosphoenolpyruvate--protein phosphotransferase [Betaproteobacteria bacterium]|jgi:phosphotransferase system enzyme I (PtsI)|nr:phosphoenolpyruvate--protein phosphotransferase [Betaproteobacteria bacterium]